MAKVYFLGGENIAKRDAREINEAAFSDAGGAPSVLVFTWARPSFDVRYGRRKRLIDYFRSLGADSVDFCDYPELNGQIVARMAATDLIYLTGGQVTTLLTRIDASGLVDLLREYKGVIVGRSAGAMVLGNRCFVKSRYSGKARIVKGLGLVNFSVKAHYEQSKDEWLGSLSKRERIYGIPYGDAVSYDGGMMRFMGDVVVFENEQKSPAISNSVQ